MTTRQKFHAATRWTLLVIFTLAAAAAIGIEIANAQVERIPARQPAPTLKPATPEQIPDEIPVGDTAEVDGDTGAPPSRAVDLEVS